MVSELQVTVARVGGVERRHDLADDRQGLVRGHPSGARQALRQGLAPQQLHGEEDPAAFPALVVHEVERAADVRVGDPVAKEDLLLETQEEALVAADLGAERLDGHTLAQLQVLGLEDLAHGPLPEESGDPVASGKDFARLQARPGRTLRGLISGCH